MSFWDNTAPAALLAGTPGTKPLVAH